MEVRPEELRIATVEMHTGGEPLRIVPQFPFPLQGESILAKRQYFREHYDYVRQLLMLEPRGHSDMYGAVIVDSPGPAHFGVLFLHNEGYSTFCGHAVIALARWAVLAGLVQASEAAETEVRIECPAGVVDAFLDNATGSVRFNSMPVFSHLTDVPITLPGQGTISVDVAYGGTFYAYVTATDVGLNLDDFSVEEAKRITPQIKGAVEKAVELQHPEHCSDVCFLYGVVYVDTATPATARVSKNVCVFAKNQVDRCPTGSSVTARMALFHAKGLARIGERMDFFCPVGRSTFTGKLVQETKCGAKNAVVVEVGGKGFFTGTCEFTAEPGDPTLPGFLPS